MCRERGKVKWASQARGKQHRCVACHNVEEVPVKRLRCLSSEYLVVVSGLLWCICGKNVRFVGLVIHTCSNHHDGMNNRLLQDAYVLMYCSLCVCLFVGLFHVFFCNIFTTYILP